MSSKSSAPSTECRRKIFIVPDGGLGNRLRTVVSGIFLAREVNAEPIIVWHQDNLCRVKLGEIIQLNRVPAAIIEPSELLFHSVYEIPRRRNLKLPALIAPLKFRNRFYDDVNLRPYCDDCPALLRLIQNSSGDCLFFSGQEFYDFPREFFREIIRPTERVIARANEILSGKKPDIAIQIRRTDHQLAIANSPLESFLRIIDNTAPLTFFLATDSQDIKDKISAIYPSRCICNPIKADRASSEGIIDAMAEIYIMSQTKQIYASDGSSFPVIASWLGQVPLIPVSR